MIKIQDEVAFENVVVTFKLAKASIAVQLAVVGLVYFFYVPYVPSAALFLWVGLHIVNYTFRWSFSQKILALQNERKNYPILERYILWYAFDLGITGALWGSLVFFLPYLPSSHQDLIYFIVVSFTYSSVLSVGSITVLFLAFSIPLNLIVILYLFSYIPTFEVQYIVVAVFILIGFLYAIKASKTYLSIYNSLLETRMQLKQHIKELRIQNINKKNYIEAIDAIGIGSITLDKAGNITAINATIQRWFGDIRHKNFQEFLEAMVVEKLDHGSMYVQTKDLHYYEFVSTDMIVDTSRSKLYVVKDVTKDIQAKKTLQKLATQYKLKSQTDQLTQVLNRSAFIEKFKENIEHIQPGHKVALLFVDMDHFKQINDNYGHDIGDKVLQITAQRLKHTIRKSDLIGRFAGDEFLIALCNLQDINVAQKILEQILQSLRQVYRIDKEFSLEVSASIGLALYPDDATTIESLIKKADQAMYRIKHNTKNDYQFFNEG